MRATDNPKADLDSPMRYGLEQPNPGSPAALEAGCLTTDTLQGRCGDCSHVFIVAHLPMELRKAAELAMAARCPKCASRQIFVAGDSAAEPDRP